MTPNLKIRKSELLTFLLLLPLYRPPYLAIESFSFLDAFFVYGKVLSFIITLIVYVKKKIKRCKKLNRIYALEIAGYLCFFICLFLSGVINNNMSEIGSAFLPVITVILLFMSYIDDDVTKMLNPLRMILYVYVMINLITILMFPNGLYTAGVNEMSTRAECGWFLGYRNPQIRILLPAVSISFICDIIKYNRIKLKSLILLFSALLTVILIKSSTAMIGFTIFILIYFIRLKWNIKVKPIWFLLYNIVFFVGIILLRLQNSISFFIVDILHKDLTFTGRTYIWDQAILMFMKNPIFGNGATEFPIGNYFVATHPHNFMLYLLVKSGLIGFILFAVSAVICAKHLEKFQENKVAQVLIMEYCAFFSMTVTESMTEAIFFWLVIIMGICVDSLCNCEEKK